jgi:hypothetical protein
MKTKDKDLLVNPLADVKPPREGPTFVEQKTESVKKIWSLIKETVSEWSFGGGWEPSSPPRRHAGGGLSGLDRLRPGAPMPQVKRPKCGICGTNDCLSDDEMRALRRTGGSLGNTLLKSCAVRRQLKEMEKFRVRTSSGKDVWMTKEMRPVRPPPPPNPPRPVDTELERLKEENEALKQLVKEEVTKRKKELEDDIHIQKMKRYHEQEAAKRIAKTADGAELLRRIGARKGTNSGGAM